MKVVFVSNYLTHHQIPFCEAMYNRLGDNFCFISSMPMDQERIQGGWELQSEYPFELKSYLDKYNYDSAKKRINRCDILILGSANKVLQQEINTEGKKIFRYSERIFKNGRLHVLSPRAIKNILKERYTSKNSYMLCASAYTAGDYGMLGAYRNKCFKWGYFPKTIYYDINELMNSKPNTRVEILWCGRFVKWKHPEDAIYVFWKLCNVYSNLHMTMIGNGVTKNEIIELAKKLNVFGKITFIDNLPPTKVRKYMERSNIFLFTSDFNEGWGAVLNEAMNSGCAIVASHAIGAVPYLVTSGENGFIYKYGNQEELYKRISTLIESPQMRRALGENAYKTIVEEWNAESAANRLLTIFEAVMKKKELDIFTEGVCSRDRFLSNNWYKEGNA